MQSLCWQMNENVQCFPLFYGSFPMATTRANVIGDGLSIAVLMVVMVDVHRAKSSSETCIVSWMTMVAGVAVWVLVDLQSTIPSVEFIDSSVVVVAVAVAWRTYRGMRWRVKRGSGVPFAPNPKATMSQDRLCIEKEPIPASFYS